MGFQKIVLIIALVILTFCIIFISSMISSTQANRKWPPEVATCPPYFGVEKSNTNPGKLKCQLVPNGPVPGSGVANCKLFELANGITPTTDCQKCKWANQCGIQWDGITSANCSKIDGCS